MPKDVLYGLRMLLKSPGFTVVALLSLALGIGANTASFSGVNQVLLHPVAYPDPDRLLVVWTTIPSEGIKQFAASVPDFLDWRAQNHAFQQMASIEADTANMTGIQRPERIQVFAGSDGGATVGMTQFGDYPLDADADLRRIGGVKRIGKSLIAVQAELGTEENVSRSSNPSVGLMVSAVLSASMAAFLSLSLGP